jgi:hypothetical protein
MLALINQKLRFIRLWNLKISVKLAEILINQNVFIIIMTLSKIFIID